MAALALPIQELETKVVPRAIAETSCVATLSNTTIANINRKIVWKVIKRTYFLKLRFEKMVRQQDSIIRSLTTNDFNAVSRTDLNELASLLESLIADERTLLADAHNLGPKIRFWWRKELRALNQQVEYLDSIAESLRIAGNSEAMTVLAFTSELVAR
jgi:hypothetical protein